MRTSEWDSLVSFSLLLKFRVVDGVSAQFGEVMVVRLTDGQRAELPISRGRIVSGDLPLGSE